MKERLQLQLLLNLRQTTRLVRRRPSSPSIGQLFLSAKGISFGIAFSAQLGTIIVPPLWCVIGYCESSYTVVCTVSCGVGETLGPAQLVWATGRFTRYMLTCSPARPRSALYASIPRRSTSVVVGVLQESDLPPGETNPRSPVVHRWAVQSRSRRLYGYWPHHVPGECSSKCCEAWLLAVRIQLNAEPIQQGDLFLGDGDRGRVRAWSHRRTTSSGLAVV